MKFARFLSVFLIAILCILNLYNNINRIDKILDSLSIEYKKNSDKEYLICIDDYNKILEKLNVVVLNKFYVEDRLVIEGYTSDINEYVVIDESRVNIQISLSDDCCVLGVPLINNSFWCIN